MSFLWNLGAVRVLIQFPIQVLVHKIFMNMNHGRQAKHQLKINKVSHIGQLLELSPHQPPPQTRQMLSALLSNLLYHQSIGPSFLSSASKFSDPLICI